MLRRPTAVYLRGLCEFPVCRLDFGPYPSVCICTVAAAAFRYRRFPAAFSSHTASPRLGSADRIQPRRPRSKRCIRLVNVQSVNHVVKNRNHRIRLNVAFDSVSIQSRFFMVPSLLRP